MTKKILLAVMVLTSSLYGMHGARATEDYSLAYFLGKVHNKGEELSKKEKEALVNRLQEVLDRAGKVCEKLVQVTEERETGFRYDEGKFWMSRLEKDRATLEAGVQQVKVLREKPGHLVASVTVYKAMRDLANSLNVYNHVPPFCPYVGELASEVELWADPVFYQGFLLPLAKSKDVEVKPSQKEKGRGSQGKKPPAAPSRPKNP